MEPKQYKKRETGDPVVAVQINLETEGLDYVKWGGLQHAKPGDWLVNNGGEVYTIDKDSFEATYQKVGHGQYRKVAIITAFQAEEAGEVQTKEGVSQYEAGDYIVNQGEGDSYCVAPANFEAMYELVAS